MAKIQNFHISPVSATQTHSSPETVFLNFFACVAHCAAEAVFCYTAENSHHLKAQVTPKNPQFQGEKISVRKKARSHVTSEKSSKTIFPSVKESPPEGYPCHPPTPLRAVTAHFTRGGRQVRSASARFTRENHSRGGGGGRGDLRNGAIR